MIPSASETSVHCPRTTEKDRKQHTQRVVCTKPVALECLYCHSIEVPRHQYVANNLKTFLQDYRAWRPKPVKGLYW